MEHFPITIYMHPYFLHYYNNDCYLFERHIRMLKWNDIRCWRHRIDDNPVVSSSYINRIGLSIFIMRDGESCHAYCRYE